MEAQTAEEEAEWPPDLSSGDPRARRTETECFEDGKRSRQTGPGETGPRNQRTQSDETNPRTGAVVACLGMPVARSVIHVAHRAHQREKVPVRRDEQASRSPYRCIRSRCDPQNASNRRRGAEVGQTRTRSPWRESDEAWIEPRPKLRFR